MCEIDPVAAIKAMITSASFIEFYPSATAVTNAYGTPLEAAFQAAYKHGMLYAIVRVGAAFNKLPAHFHGDRKQLLVLGDDDLTSCGPAGFADATIKAVLEGADLVVLNSADIDSMGRVYKLATDEAIARGKAVIVETRPEHAAEWHACITRHVPNCPVLPVTP